MAAVAEVAEVPQHEWALNRANEVRLKRAELKRRIKRGEATVREVLEDTPWEAHSMPIMELLMAPLRWGRERSRRALFAAGGGVPGGIPELKPVGELTERQRKALSALV